MLIMLLCARKELFRRLAKRYLCCQNPPPRKSLSRASLSTASVPVARRHSQRQLSVSLTQQRAELRRASLTGGGGGVVLEPGAGLEAVLSDPSSFVLLQSDVPGELFVCPVGPSASVPSSHPHLTSLLAAPPITEESSDADSDAVERPKKPRPRVQHAAITLQAKRELNRMRRAESLRSGAAGGRAVPTPPAPRVRTLSANLDSALLIPPPDALPTGQPAPHPF